MTDSDTHTPPSTSPSPSLSPATFTVLVTGDNDSPSGVTAPGCPPLVRLAPAVFAALGVRYNGAIVVTREYAPFPHSCIARARPATGTASVAVSSSVRVNYSDAALYHWRAGDCVQVHSLDDISGSSASVATASSLEVLIWPARIDVYSSASATAHTVALDSARLASALSRQWRGQVVVPCAFSSVLIAESLHLVWISNITVSASGALADGARVTRNRARVDSSARIEWRPATESPASVAGAASTSVPSSAFTSPMRSCFPSESRALIEFISAGSFRHGHNSTQQLESRFVGHSRCRCALLTGPPRAGKSFLLSAISEYYPRGQTIVLGSRADSSDEERTVAELTALSHSTAFGALILADDIDTWLLPKSNQSPRLRAAFIALLDAVDACKDSTLCIIGAVRTNKRASIQRTCPRFDRIIEIAPLTRDQRATIIEQHLHPLSLNVLELSSVMADRTHGWVCGDLHRLCRRALIEKHAWHTIDVVTLEHFTVALQAFASTNIAAVRSDMVSAPSIALDSYTMTPHSLFKEVGGYDTVKQRLMLYIQTFQKSASTGLSQPKSLLAAPRGILLTGKSGMGKSCFLSSFGAVTIPGLAAITVRLTNVLSPLLGESEAALRAIFARARAQSPCVLVMDDLDALMTGKRDADAGARGGGFESRLLSSLLQEMDGVASSAPVLVIGATSRPDALDSALTRAGRFDAILHLAPPTRDDVHDILRLTCEHEGATFGADVSLDCIAERVIGSSPSLDCARVVSIVRRSAWAAFREGRPGVQEAAVVIQARHLRVASGDPSWP